MKNFLFILALLGLTLSATAQISTSEPARLKTKVTCFEGKTNAAVANIGVNLAPETIFPNKVQNNSLTTHGAQASELTWKFVWRENEYDVYRFTFKRFTEPGASNQVTTTKEIRFNGKTVVVFKDQLHTVVLELPGDADLKAAQQT